MLLPRGHQDCCAGPGWQGCLGMALLAASPARGGFAGTQGLRRPTRSWETRRASRSPSSISVCCRMWRLHSPWAGNARGRSAGGGVSLGHDPTAVGRGTGQVGGRSQRNPHPQPHSQPHGPRPVRSRPARPPSPVSGSGLLAPSSHTFPPPPPPPPPTPSEKRSDAHSPCKCPSRLSPDRLALSSSRLGRYGCA